ERAPDAAARRALTGAGTADHRRHLPHHPAAARVGPDHPARRADGQPGAGGGRPRLCAGDRAHHGPRLRQAIVERPESARRVPRNPLHLKEPQLNVKKFASQADLEEKQVSFTKLSDHAYAYTAEGDPNTDIVIGDDAVMVID